MAKKKSERKKSKRKGQRPASVSDPKKEMQAIKTMLIGAVVISFLMLFFAFDINGSTLYERTFGGGDAPPAKTTPTP
jgi:hypothetical protein